MSHPAPVPNVSTYERLRLEVLDALAKEQVDGRNAQAVTGVVRARVHAYQQRAENGAVAGLANPADTVDRLVRSLTGAGPLQKFFDDPSLADEVIVKGGTITFWTRDGRQEVDREPTCEAELTGIAQRLLSDAGATVDLENPVVVHQVWDNRVRASVSIPPVADELDATFRIYWARRTDLADVVEWGSRSPTAASVLGAFMLSPTGVLVTGGPGSGKSTIVSALLRVTPATINTGSSKRPGSSRHRIFRVGVGRRRPAGTRSAALCAARCSSPRNSSWSAKRWARRRSSC
ncbi:MAG: ATPase, T2SS/T4P/T4SS family [Ilumatobacteraceae bacterium]